MSQSAENGPSVKRAIVVGLETLCGWLDRIPRHEEGRRYRHGCWGCYPLNLAGRAADLDERWGTGIWKDAPEQTWPHYFSTYCIHEQHGDCRLTCKVCRAVCRCDCHAPTPPGTQP